MSFVKPNDIYGIGCCMQPSSNDEIIGCASNVLTTHVRLCFFLYRKMFRKPKLEIFISSCNRTCWMCSSLHDKTIGVSRLFKWKFLFLVVIVGLHCGNVLYIYIYNVAYIYILAWCVNYLKVGRGAHGEFTSNVWDIYHRGQMFV